MLQIFRFKRHDLAIVALLCALYCSTFGSPTARAQTAPTQTAPTNPMAGRDMAPVTGAVPIPVSREQLKGAPLFWASDLTDINDLPAYKSLGLNTVVVRLNWNPDTDANNLAAVDVKAAREFAEAAARTGLKIIYALPPTPQGMEFQMRIAGDSPSYNALWTAWASNAIATLRDTPNLTGWMLPDDPRSLPMWSDEAFRRWIGRNYANIGVLNAQWGTDYRELDQILAADVDTLAERNRGGAPAYGGEALGPLGTRGKPIVQNAAFHPSQLALAAYRWEAYRELLVTWIGVVRGADSNHLLFSGELPDYAQLLSLPAGIDVVLPAVAPGVAENDIVTHNPQAIDIARRGDKFSAIPIFSMRGDGDIEEALPELSKRWLQAACARGASGIGFDSWPDLKKNLDLRQSLLEKLRELNRVPFAGLWGDPPVATTAVVLTPLADGATFGFGPIAQGGRRGLYGWAENLIEGEPSNLVWSLRWGTAFGSVDYLAPEDLDGNLEVYPTILAPQMLSCSLQNQTALTNYVTGGGVLVADIGLGALQSGGQIGVLPPAMSLLFGVPGTYEVRPVSFNLKAGAPHELFPLWNRMMQMRPNVTLTHGDASGGDAFAGPVGFSLATPVATIIGVGPQIGTRVGNGQTALLSAHLTANDAGRGVAIWAPFRMWDHWRPGHTGFEEFHAGLMARGATLAISKNSLGVVDDVVPVTINAAPGITRFAEIVNRARDVTFINHDAPGQPLQLASVETTGVGDWLWSGGITQLPNAQGVALIGGRPAPIEGASAFESRMRPVSLLTSLGYGEMTGMHMEPISAQNLNGGPLCGQVISNTRAGADVYVWPNAGVVMPDQTFQSWQPVPTIAGKFRLTIYSSPTGVSWAPGTRVRATATSMNVVQSKKGDKLNTSTDQQFAVVDARGRATWEFEGTSVRVQIAGS